MTFKALLVVTVVCALDRAAVADPDPGATAGSATNLDDVSDIKELSLADLLDTQVDIASKKPQTTRETPGIVTVITRDEILGSGARDLLDVLVLVPGFAPAVDVENVVDLGVRGNWGHEGKILLLIDGQPMNELLYSTLQLASHYPLESIDHIEVIRGPGSAIYGGYAELAVINIVTRDPAHGEGVAVAGTYGRLGHGLGRANLDVSFATTSTGIKDLSVAGSVLIGQSSGRGTYRDFAGNTFLVAGNTDVDPMFAQLAIKYHRLRVDAIVDNYAMQTREGFGPALAEAAHESFRAFYLNASLAIPMREHVTLTPRLGLIHQTPWEISDPTSELFYTKTIDRYVAGATVTYDPTKQVDVLAGVEAYADRAHVNDPRVVGSQTLFGTSTDVAYDTIATYGQVLFTHPIANLTIGARYEHQSAVGGSLVPRIALTKVSGRFHAKLLASQAFREPGVENINLSGGSLQPEKTTVFEAEAGAELGDHMFVVANAFDITIRKPIIYEYDQLAMVEQYRNFDHTGTRGVEVDYRIKYPRVSADLNYSFYTSANKNAVAAYQVPDRDQVLLAFPAHKVAMSGSVKLYEGLTVNPSAVIYGERFGYLSGDASGNPVIGRQPPTALVNLYLRYRDVLVPGLELGAGAYDIADQRYEYLQPYNGGHAPLPGPGRELVFRIAYEHKL